MQYAYLRVYINVHEIGCRLKYLLTLSSSKLRNFHYFSRKSKMKKKPFANCANCHFCIKGVWYSLHKLNLKFTALPWLNRLYSLTTRLHLISNDKREFQVLPKKLKNLTFILNNFKYFYRNVFKETCVLYSSIYAVPFRWTRIDCFKVLNAYGYDS